MPTLDDAINVIRTGDTDRGREILEEILETDENNEDVWLWLSSVVDSDEDREICLENVLAINPDNIVAQRGLEALRQGTFNVHNIMEEALDEFEEIPEEDDDDFSSGTFLDEFTLAGEDEELEFPSTMKSGKKGSGLNIRIILIVALVLCIVTALGGAAAYNILGGDTGPIDVPPQETPADGGQPGTETPISPPTDTPTPTHTPFQLPTKEPTEAPTPTATIVVSPTSPTD